MKILFFNFKASPGFGNVFFYFYAILSPDFQIQCHTNKVFLSKSHTKSISYQMTSPNALKRVGRIFFLSHHILLYSEASSSGRGFNLFSLTKLQHTHCLTSLKSSKSLLSLTRNPMHPMTSPIKTG